jgi:hypothetical protein
MKRYFSLLVFVFTLVFISCTTTGTYNESFFPGRTPSSASLGDTLHKSQLLEFNNKYKTFIEEYKNYEYFDSLYILYEIVNENLDYIINNYQSIKVIREEARNVSLLNSIKECRGILSSGSGYKYKAYMSLTSGLMGWLNSFINGDAYPESHVDNILFFREEFLNNYKLAKQEQVAYEERQRFAEEQMLERQRQDTEQQKEANEAFVKFFDIHSKKALDAGSPILIFRHFTVISNYAGGVNCRIQFTNVSNKRIKYVDFTVIPYNRVDDIAHSSVDGESEKTIQAVDYILPNSTYQGFWENVWYNSAIDYMEIARIKVTYDDNTTQVVNNEEMIEAAMLNRNEYLEYENLVDRVRSFIIRK